MGVALTPQLEEQLARVSRATVQRMTSKLRSLGRANMCLPRRGPERANRTNSATKGVPMGRRWGAYPGRHKSRDTSRWTWCITADQARKEIMPTLYR